MKKMKTKNLFLLAFIAMTLLACNKTNPLLEQPNTPYGVPAFDQVKTEHYLPAFEKAIAANKAEVEAIANQSSTPTFENTIVALDRAGGLLERVEGVFFNVLEADGNDEMNAIAEQVSPMLSDLSASIILNDKLFQRVKHVYDERETLGLTSEQMRLLTETYKRFADNGANLPADKKERLKAINQELGLLSLKFGNNVVAETNAYQYFVKDEAELKGLPESAKAAAAEEAAAAGHPGEWLFTPKRTSFTPVLQYCENRDLRRELLMAYTTRANHDNDNDNKAVIIREMELRIERAKLFGYDNPADYILADCMAKNHQTVDVFLQSVWEPSLKAAKREAAELQKMMDAEKMAQPIHTDDQVLLQPWDWWYYTEKLRKAKYALDEEELKPYFELNNVRKGAFGVATKLFGLQFEKMEGMPVYNPEVEVFKVTESDGSLVGILYTDYFPRAGKRPGAWMNNIMSQYVDENGVDHRPVIINVGNFNKPTAGNPSLLSMDDVETLFHEFGHALHGLLSKAHYKSLSGTNTPRDFVELPSQFMENYAYEPEVLKTYAFHYQTGEVIPDELVKKINAAGKFNQGFVTTELLSASILDMDFHELTTAEGLDVNAFEAASMAKMHMIPQIIVRYRPTFYNHIFTTGYEAGYYSYTWAAVLDADAFAAFKETGNIFDEPTARSWRHLLEQGGTRDAQELYVEFRGKEADPKNLLRRKGFID